MNDHGLVVNENKGFWKKNSHNVPGRPSPKKSVFSSSSTSSQGNTSTSFQAFQASISDAWDIDDDEEFCEINVNISKKASQEAALNVIDQQSQDQVRNKFLS